MKYNNYWKCFVWFELDIESKEDEEQILKKEFNIEIKTYANVYNSLWQRAKTKLNL